MDLSTAMRQRIINLAKENGMSIKDISNRVGVDESIIDNFLLGQSRTITTNTFFIICCGLGVEMGEFFEDKLFENVYYEEERGSSKEKI